MADDNFVELFKATVQSLEDQLGGNEPNTHIYAKQCAAMVHGFAQVRNNLPILLRAAAGVSSAPIFKELYSLACKALRILKLCCEEQTWLQSIVLLDVHSRNGPKGSTFGTLRDELDWCINILRSNIDEEIHLVRLTHRDREVADEEHLKQKLLDADAVESGTAQEPAELVEYVLPRLNASNGQPWDRHCRCIQQLNCWQYQETLPLSYLIEGPVEGGREGLEGAEQTSVSINLTWFGIRVAEKVFRNGDAIRSLWKTEADIMATLTHPNVVSFIGCLDSPSAEGEAGPAIIMECARQSLKDYLIETLQQENNGDVQTLAEMRPRARPLLDEVVAVDLLSQIASGMEYLHSHDVAHLDLKLENLLVTSHPEDLFLHVKIADFGDSMRLKGRSGKIRNRRGLNRGTTEYLAPELFSKDNWVCFKSADVCSFGFTAWAILHCHEPKLPIQLENGRSYREPYGRALVAGNRLPFDQSIPVELQQLVRNCWNKTPENRLPFSDIYRYLQSYKAVLLGSRVQLLRFPQIERTERPSSSGVRLWPRMLRWGSRGGQLDEQHEESV